MVVGDLFILAQQQFLGATLRFVSNYICFVIIFCELLNLRQGNVPNDIYNPNCATEVTFYSACGEDSFNTGIDSLVYTCADEPSDLSGFCSSCPSGQYACCGSVTCSTDPPVCDATQAALCPDNAGRRGLLGVQTGGKFTAASGPIALVAGLASFALWFMFRGRKTPKVVVSLAS